MGSGGSDGRFERAKWATFATTILSMVIGTALVIVGLYSLVTMMNMRWVSHALPITSMAIGVFLVFFSFMGCFGTFFENRKLLIIYMVGLLILVAAQYAVAGLALSHNGPKLRMTLDEGWNDIYNSRPSLLREVEYRYGCCGLFDVNDRAFPVTNNTKYQCSNNRNFGYEEPCYKFLRHEIRHAEKGFAIGVFVIAALQTIGILSLSYFLSRLPGGSMRSQALQSEFESLLDPHKTRTAYNTGSHAGSSA